jgi:hypothetical protein
VPDGGRGRDQRHVHDRERRYEVRRNGQRIADYLTSGNVFSYTPPSTSSLGKLHLDLPVNVYPTDPSKQWRLVTDVVLRNTVRA